MRYEPAREIGVSNPAVEDFKAKAWLWLVPVVGHRGSVTFGLPRRVERGSRVEVPLLMNGSSFFTAVFRRLPDGGVSAASLLGSGSTLQFDPAELELAREAARAFRAHNEALLGSMLPE
jgi:hypothetical protein